MLAVTGWAIALGVALGVPDDVFGTGEHFLRLSIVVAGGLLAIWTAGIRQSRERTAELLGAQAAVARILAESDSLEEASPRILEAVGLTLGWEAGAIWRVRRRRNLIECVESWADDDIDATGLTEQGRGLAFSRGEGLPGQSRSTACRGGWGAIRSLRGFAIAIWSTASIATTRERSITSRPRTSTGQTNSDSSSKRQGSGM